jgi:spore maturation protein CgeB
MRLLVVHPGARYSTADVFNGLVPALERLGHEVVPYALDGRLAAADAYGRFVWERHPERDRLKKPSTSDAIYLASQELPYKAIREEVDATLIITAMFLHPEALRLMHLAGLRTGLVLTESPYDDAEQARVLPFIDVAWTNERTSVAPLREHNPRVHYLPVAYDPTRHRADAGGGADDVPAHDVVFVGSAFPERVRLLEAVNWDGIDLALYGKWDGLPESSPIHRFVRGGVIGNERAAELYRRAKIGLNLYRQAVGAESLNPRAVELAACGVFQISDYRKEVEEVFGGSVVTFSTAERLGECVRHFLGEGALREEHRLRAMEAVQGRTFDRMAEQVSAQLAEVG